MCNHQYMLDFYGDGTVLRGAAVLYAIEHTESTNELGRRLALLLP